MSKSGASGSVTPRIKLLAILPSQIPLTPKKIIVIMSKNYLIYVRNHLEENKTKLGFEATFSTYQENSLYSLGVVGRGDVLAMGNPSK